METIINILQTAGFSGNDDQMRNIMIQFDGQMCLEAEQASPPRSAVDRWVMEHLPVPEGVNVNAAKLMSSLLQQKRKYFLISMRAEQIRAYPLLLRAFVHSHLLSMVADGVPEKAWRGEILRVTEDVRSKKYTNITQEIIEEYLELYKGCGQILTADTRKLLRKNQRAFDRYTEKMHGCLQSLQEDAPAPQTASKRVRPSFLNTKERKIRFQCLLEYALQEQEKDRRDWFTPVRQLWNDFLPELVLVENLAKQVAAAVNRTLPGQTSDSERRRHETSLERYYRALGVALEEGGVQQIRNEAVLRNLMMNRTVALYVSCLDPEQLSSNTVESAMREVLGRLSQISYVAGASDTDDLKQILELYMEDSRFVPELVRLMTPHRELYKKLYRSTMEFMNSRNQAFQTLSNQLEQIDQYRDAVTFDIRKDLVNALDRGSHGYCLGRMYRVATGRECLSPDDTRNLMSSFFYLLENLGIQAVGGDLLDGIVREDDPFHSLCVPFYNDNTKGVHKLVYPGWAIGGCQVAPPVYHTEED